MPQGPYYYYCRTYTEKYGFFDFECFQNTGKHIVNLVVVQDFWVNTYEFYNIDEFCSCDIKNIKVSPLLHTN